MLSIEKQKKESSRSKVRSQLTSEHDEQVAVIAWAKAAQGKYPELKLLYAIPNASGFAQSEPFIRRGVRLPPLPLIKQLAEGLKKGMPDLCLPVARGGYHSLYVEMKRFDGKLSDEQKKVQSELIAQGNSVATCYSSGEAIHILHNYLKMRQTDDMD